jgi:hypothetical protein
LISPEWFLSLIQNDQGEWINPPWAHTEGIEGFYLATVAQEVRDKPQATGNVWMTKAGLRGVGQDEVNVEEMATILGVNEHTRNVSGPITEYDHYALVKGYELSENLYRCSLSGQLGVHIPMRYGHPLMQTMSTNHHHSEIMLAHQVVLDTMDTLGLSSDHWNLVDDQLRPVQGEAAATETFTYADLIASVVRTAILAAKTVVEVFQWLYPPAQAQAER